jgi:hypothetical protein
VEGADTEWRKREQCEQQNIATEKSEITANRHGFSTSPNIGLQLNVSLADVRTECSLHASQKYVLKKSVEAHVIYVKSY